MAEGGNIPELGGYNYEFTSKVPEDWECLVCHLTLKDAVQIEQCGHRLCNICMESLLRRPSATCPADRQPLSREKIFSDTACRRQILNLTVKCSHSECSWTGELRAVEKHQSECLFKVVKCPNAGCTRTLSKRDITTHETLECSWRKVNCEYCQESVIMNQKQKHFDICRKFPVLCSNKCGVRDIPREKLEVHVRDECPATEVQCEYKNLGCEEVFPRSDAKSHSQTQIESHLNLALRGLETTQHQVQELLTVVRDQSQQIERQSQQIERLMSKDKEQSEKMERLMSTVQDQSQQIKQLISKNEKQSEKMERSMYTVEDHPLLRQPRGLMKLNFSTPFEWKIPDLRDFFKKAEYGTNNLVCEPFYLFECGYRYLLKIEIQRLTFRQIVTIMLRAFIKVVPGEFDELLPWPCKEKVRVTLVGQNPVLGITTNISNVIDFEKGVGPCSRPVRDDHHKYRIIHDLNKYQLRLYTTDDTVLIRVKGE